MQFRLLGLWAMLLVVVSSSAWGGAEVQTKREVAGFYWVYDDGTKPYQSASENTDAITMLCPTWLNVVDAEGTVKVQTDPKITALAKAKGIKILPLIANEGFKPKPFHWILVSPSRRTKLINRILEVLDGMEYCQGVNLDLEGLAPEDRPLYTEFLEELSAKLRPHNYLISIDVPAKVRDNPQSAWSGAFDYAEINKYCDLIMIMTYDEHWGGGKPGPIASTGFVDQCLKYATSQIPKEKLLLGIPFYGYDWAEKGRTRGAFYTTAIKRAKNAGSQIQWDEESKSPWFTYKENGIKRTCWFENKESLAAKLELGHKYEVGGICIWSLGDEDPGSWDVIRQYRGK